MLSSVKIFQTLVLELLCTATVIYVQSDSLELQHNSQTIPNNSLLILTEIGTQLDNSVQCITSRLNCCSSAETLTGQGLGDWFLPDGSNLNELENTGTDMDFYLMRGNGSLDLFRRNNIISPEGLFYCEIIESNEELKRVYVGLYLKGNGELILGNIRGVMWRIEVWGLDGEEGEQWWIQD